MNAGERTGGVRGRVAKLAACLALCCTGALVLCAVGVAWAGPPAVAGGPLASAPIARDDGHFRAEATLESTAMVPGDTMGWAVDVDGDTAIVSAQVYSGYPATTTGHALIYVREGSSWVQQAKLVPSDGVIGDEFGSSVAISGDVAVVGSPFNDNRKGAVYVYYRTGTTWNEVAKLTASDPQIYSYLGRSCDIDGLNIVGGSLYASAPSTVNAGAAYVWTKPGATWIQEAKVQPNDPVRENHFGYAVGISGDNLGVGAYEDNGWTGTAYAFHRTASTWAQETKLAPSDPQPLAYFGRSVSVSGERMIVGAEGAGWGYPGAAYVYSRTGTSWAQEARLATDVPYGVDPEFGFSVKLVGDVAVVGAFRDSTGGAQYQGAAYVFGRQGGDWPILACVTATNGAAGDSLGWSVGYDGETLIAGAMQRASDKGAAYIFSGIPPFTTRENVPLTITAPGVLINDTSPDSLPLTATIETTPTHGSVVLSDNGSFVYTPNHDYHGPDWFTYRASDGTLTSDIATVSIEIRSINDTPVAVADSYTLAEDTTKTVAALGVLSNDSDHDGDPLTAQVLAYPKHGALVLDTDGSFTYRPFQDWNGTDYFQYAAYDGIVYSQATTVTLTVTPVQDLPVADPDKLSTARLTTTAPNPTMGGEFGGGVAAGADTVIVGAPGDRQGSVPAGAAYVYVRSGAGWVKQATLAEPLPASSSRFGKSVALQGNTALVAAPGWGNSQGCVHVFTRSGSVWSHAATLTASDGQMFSEFGSSLAIYGNTAAVGAYRAGWMGEVYVFTGAGTAWSEQATLTAPSRDWFEDFGGSVALEGDRLLVGAPGANSSAGEAHTFTRSAGTWSHESTLLPSGGASSDGFGTDVALAGKALVGAPSAVTSAGVDAGVVYAFDRGSGIWVQSYTLMPPASVSGAQFGTSVDASGGIVVVGAPSDASPAGEGSGAMYLFDGGLSARVEGSRRYTAALGRMSDYGRTVTISGGTIAVGAPGTDAIPNYNVGGAEIFYNLKRFTTAEDVALSVAAPGLASNDFDPDGTSLSAVVYSQPAHGLVTGGAGGSFTYTPAADWFGTDTFRYRAFDGLGYSAPATVTVVVTPVADAPRARSDVATAAANATLTVAAPGVLGNDFEPDGQAMVASLVTGPQHGTLALAANGSYVYRPAAGYTGADSFRYRAGDGALWSSPATVSITVTDTSPVVRTVTRIDGANRYDVAVNMARKGWDPAADKSWPGVKYIVVACGEDRALADPLAAAGVCGVYNAPLLLVPSTGIVHTKTKTVISEVAAKNKGITVVAVGGPASVPPAALSIIDAIPNVTVQRIGGADRYEVTANIARRMIDVTGTANIPGVLLVCAEKPGAFYDALAVSPAAFARSMPMLGLRVGSTIPTPVRALLNGPFATKQRYVVSSTTYTPALTASKAGATARIASSASPYAASNQIASFSVAQGWLTPADTGIASKLSDALGGGAYMGHRRGVLLYTSTATSIFPSTQQWIIANKTAIRRGWIFGGTASVPLGQETGFRNLLK